MKLDDIKDLWDVDSKLNADDLQREALDVAYLHNKYYKIYLDERARYRMYVLEQKKLHRLKYEYYTGTIDTETLKARNWPPFSLRVLRTDVPMYLDSDTEMQMINERVELQKDKVEYLESIIKSINNRNFQVKNVIDWLKWSQGSM